MRLWPEHFDIAIELGSEPQGVRANYGFSPGDEGHHEPYLYVGPWSAAVDGDLWKANGFAGAELSYSELIAADDQLAAAFDFFASRRDALTALANKGVIRRIQPAGSPARYEDRVGDNHHHLICRSCRRMVDVDCAAGDTPCLSASDDYGFDIDEAEVIYWGRCPECTAAAAAGGL